MIAVRNDQGLFEINIRVKGARKERALRGIIDTGSSDCACTYRVITTLHVKPRDWQIVRTVSKTQRYLVYDAQISFDGKSQTTPIIRVPDIIDGFDFIIGLSILDKCRMVKEGEMMEITWSP